MVADAAAAKKDETGVVAETKPTPPPASSTDKPIQSDTKTAEEPVKTEPSEE